MPDDMDKLVSSISILYHTRENRNQEHALPEHSILSSSLSSEPTPMDPRRFASGKYLRAVNHLDLGKNHIAQIDFQAHRKGVYTLVNGTRLNLRGVLAFHPIQEEAHTPGYGNPAQFLSDLVGFDGDADVASGMRSFPCHFRFLRNIRLSF